jgi:hypothetical protein
MGNFLNHARIIDRFKHPTWSLSFDAFLCDQFLCSQPNARSDEGSPDVAHSGAAGSVPAISRPTLPVWDYITFPQAMIAAANKGKGWHLMTAVEWAILAEWSRINGTMPHGGNANTDPPSDVTYTSEEAQIDQHLHGANAAYHRALPGTGPNTWAHNHKENGVWDLQGLTLQWIMGLAGVGTDWTTNGYPRILAKTDLKYLTSAFGRGTISGSGGATPTLTCDGAGVNWLKGWTTDEFNGMYIYIAEAAAGAGAWYTITDTTPTTIILTNADAPGNGTATFYVAKVISVDITAGMTSGNKILTLRDADANLKPFAIPATSDGTGSDTYGKDGYWFDKGAERAALRGGGFSHVASAGVFALGLSYGPSDAVYIISFRACKCL